MAMIRNACWCLLVIGAVLVVGTVMTGRGDGGVAYAGLFGGNALIIAAVLGLNILVRLKGDTPRGDID